MSRALGHIALVGMGRSGSTYLEGTVARELGGVAVGELPGVWGAWQVHGKLCSCGALAAQCPFWGAVVERYPGLSDRRTASFMQRMNARTLPIRSAGCWPVLFRRARRGTGDEALYAREVHRLYEGLGSAAETLGYDVVVDSSKHPYWFYVAAHVGPLDRFNPRAALRLVRHPRPVAYSLRHPRTEQTATGQNPVQNAYSLLQAVPYWLVMNLAGDIAAGKDAIMVRYEDLDGSWDYIDRLVAMGFRRSAPAATDSQRRWSHQVHGNSSRQDAAAHEFRRDTRWAEERIGWQEALAWRSLSPLLRRYGYRSEPPH